MSDPGMIKRIKQAVTIPVMAKVGAAAAAGGPAAGCGRSPYLLLLLPNLTPWAAKPPQARIGHFVEAQILESIGIDFIDESEVLTPADETHHINKHNFKVPVLCGCRNLGEALRRIAEARYPPAARRPAARRAVILPSSIALLRRPDASRLGTLVLRVFLQSSAPPLARAPRKRLHRAALGV